MSIDFKPRLHRMACCSVVIVMTIIALGSTCPAQSPWPSWRGPNGNGTTTSGNYATKWSEEDGIDWKFPLQGRGASSPILLDNRLYVTLGRDGLNTLLAIDATSGKLVWERNLGKEKPGKNAKASGSNSSPVTDGKNVFVYFKSGDFAAFSPAGDIVWSLNIQEKYGEDSLWWDLGTSPILTDRAVVVTVMQTGPSFLVALDKATGKELWKADRWLDVREEANQSYTTPTIAKLAAGDAIMTLGADHVTAHSASDGKLLWKLGGFNPANDGYFRSIASPVVVNDLVICPYARGSTVTAVRTDPKLSDEDRISWKLDFGSDVPTPVVSRGKLFLLGDKGLVSCIKPESGETLWSQQLPKSNRQYSSSPVVANGYLYCVREDATTFVLSEDGALVPNSESKVWGENRLSGTAVATPVFANDRIYLRTFEALYCIGK